MFQFNISQSVNLSPHKISDSFSPVKYVVRVLIGVGVLLLLLFELYHIIVLSATTVILI